MKELIGSQHPEKKEGPQVEIIFLLTPHNNAADARKFPEALKNADVYAPENIFHPLFEDMLNRVSKGLMKPKDFLDAFKEYIESRGPGHTVNAANSRFILATLEVLYGSRKPVIVIDYDNHFGNPEFTKGARAEKYRIVEMEEAFSKGDLDLAIARMRAFMKYIVDNFVTDRERHIVEGLKEKLESITDKFPDLRELDKIKVLVTFGSIHTSLSNSIARELNIPVRREFNFMPYRYAYIHEVMRRYQHGKDVDDEIIARSIIEGFIMRELSNYNPSFEVKVLTARKIASPCSIAEIKGISEIMSKGRTFREAAAAYNVFVPRNEEEFENVAVKESEILSPKDPNRGNQ